MVPLLRDPAHIRKSLFKEIYVHVFVQQSTSTLTKDTVSNKDCICVKLTLKEKLLSNSLTAQEHFSG